MLSNPTGPCDGAGLRHPLELPQRPPEQAPVAAEPELPVVPDLEPRMLRKLDIGDLWLNRLIMPELPSVAGLVDEYSKAWNPETQTFDGIVSTRAEEAPCAAHEHDEVLRLHTTLYVANKLFASETDYSTSAGFIDCRRLPESTKMFVRGDLHGSLRALLDNLVDLRRQGFVDEQFICEDDVHLVFLGDYRDRGSHSLQVMQLLASLRLKNPNQVHLIRGNHENVYANDTGLWRIYQKFPFIGRAIFAFDLTMPLSMYFGQEAGAETEYIQLTHALFDPQVDPFPLLTFGQDARVDVPLLSRESYGLSQRVHDLASPIIASSTQVESRMQQQKLAAQRIKDLMLKNLPIIHEELDLIAQGLRPAVASSYLWGDVRESETYKTKGPGDSRGAYEWSFHPDDVYQYLRVSGLAHLLVRGHQHKFTENSLDKIPFCTTLPIAKGISPRYDEYYEEDTVMLFVTAKTVLQWLRGFGTAKSNDPRQIHWSLPESLSQVSRR